MFKNVLISVSDKTGLLEFLKKVQPIRIVSTGGTAKYLTDNGFKVVDVSEQTGAPEVMGGRIKTLHPRVHMALLSRSGNLEDAQLLRDEEIAPFDLLICNLYPFEQAVFEQVDGAELIEKIDIGGPSMLRAAGKNFLQLTVICDPTDYNWIAEGGSLSLEQRKHLAAKVFAHTAAYDTLVAEKLGAGMGPEFSLAGAKVQDLRYGENPQQLASWYRKKGFSEGLHAAKVLQGKVLSYNNILDLDVATALVASFHDAAAVAVKHGNPCGVAEDSTLNSALAKVLQADPVSIFGGIVAVNRKITEIEAALLSPLFLECLIAPDYSEQALDIFSKKKNFRVLRWPRLLQAHQREDVRTINGGFLVQTADLFESEAEKWKWIGQTPELAVIKDLQFAEKVCASLKSNAIVIVKNGQTVGLGMGQVNRVEAVSHAVERMQSHFGSLKDVVLASDAFFPFPDSIQKASEAGVRWIVQPGGSLKDEQIFAAAKEYGIGMAVTGVRHFRH